MNQLKTDKSLDCSLHQRKMKSSRLLEQKGHRALHFIGLPGSIAAETKGETEDAGELFELGQFQFGRNRPTISFQGKRKDTWHHKPFGYCTVNHNEIQLTIYPNA